MYIGYKEELINTKSKYDAKYALKHQCPNMILNHGPMVNQETVKFSWRPFNKIGNVIGCDSVTCKQCWDRTYGYDLLYNRGVI